MTTRVPAALLGSILVACGGGSPSATSPIPATAESPATSPVTDTTGAQVVIAFYDDAACTHEVGRRRYDTAQACFAWVASGSNAQENSATRFQCFSDRLCYTQHPDSLDCAGGLATDKEARTGLCLKEPAGRLYSMLQSGNEGCPAPPPGFQCPLSAPGAGTR
jgi:hypothetical protein